MIPMWLRNWRMWPCVPFDHKPDPHAPHCCKRCGTQLRDLPAPKLTDPHPKDTGLRARVEGVMARCNATRDSLAKEGDLYGARCFDDAGEWIRRALDGAA